MKTIRYLLLGLGLVSALFAADSVSNYKSESRISSEVFSSRVLKVLSFTEGEYEYRAYIVEWRGHEVVVGSLHASKDDKAYAVGDEIRCRMMSLQRGGDEKSKAPVSFVIASPGGQSASELEAVINEVRARQLQRPDPAAASAKP